MSGESVTPEQYLDLATRLESAEADKSILEDDVRELVGALREIRDLVYRQSLPITSAVHDIANAMLAKHSPNLEGTDKEVV